MKKITICLILFLSAGLSAQALDPEKAFADNVNSMTNIQQLLKMSNESAQQELFSRQELVLKRLVELRPFNPELKFALIKSYAQQDKKTEAYNDLIALQSAGLSYPIGDKEGFENLKGTGVFDYIEEGMKGNALPFGEGKEAFTVSDNYSGMLFENMAYDKQGERFLLGSIRAGAVYQYSEKGGFKEFVNPSNPTTGPWGIVDLAVDEKSDLLWLASATMPHYSGTTQANFGNAMISKLKLSTGELLKNYAMAKSAQPMLFTNLHVTRGQNIYFTNVFGSGVFKVASDSDQVESVIALPGLGSIKALTSNNAESVLYVSDYEQGIFLVNLETKQVAPLVSNKKGFVAGINDLFYDDGDLVAIQSGVQPERLMRYVLKDDLFMQNMFPIEASNPEFNSLGNGVLVDDKVYYAANTQWANIDGMGRLLPGISWEPLVIMQSPSKYKMDEHMERMKRMQEIKRKRGIK